MNKFLSLMLLLLVPTTAKSEFILSVGTDTFVQGTGTRLLSIFLATSDSAPNDVLSDLTVQFAISQGEFQQVAGTFSAPGMVATGNTQPGSTFSNQSIAGLPQISILNIQFNGNQTFNPGGVLAAFFIDANALAVGKYDIEVLNVDSTPGRTITLSDGSFTITAVPEPSSLVLVGLAAAGGVGYFRRRQRSKRNAIQNNWSPK